MPLGTRDRNSVVNSRMLGEVSLTGGRYDAVPFRMNDSGFLGSYASVKRASPQSPTLTTGYPYHAESGSALYPRNTMVDRVSKVQCTRRRKSAAQNMSCEYFVVA